jgi:hypothetical protein
MASPLENKKSPGERIVQEIIAGELGYRELVGRLGHEAASRILNAVTAGQLGILARLQVEEYVRDLVRSTLVGGRQQATGTVGNHAQDLGGQERSPSINAGMTDRDCDLIS